MSLLSFQSSVLLVAAKILCFILVWGNSGGSFAQEGNYKFENYGNDSSLLTGIAISGSVEKNDGTPYSVTASDVPVDAFWSIIVYDEKGFIPENKMKSYSFNDVTANPNQDGSITINFGGCEDGRVNCIPVSQGWNYTIRMYEPREAVLNGIYQFPELTEVK